MLWLINAMGIVLCYQIAKMRQSNARFWGLMGLLFGPLALPFVFFSTPKKPEKQT